MMENLWAPWRLKYIKEFCGDDVPHNGCVFCIQDDEVDDIERLILQRGEHCFVIMNLFPYNNGHILIAPYRHTSDFTSLTAGEKTELMDMLTIWAAVEKEAMCCQGFNIGVNVGSIAGAGIADHLHFHMVPRWNGDTNFMTAVGDVKVIPQSLEETYSSLKSVFEEKTKNGKNRDQ